MRYYITSAQYLLICLIPGIIWATLKPMAINVISNGALIGLFIIATYTGKRGIKDRMPQAATQVISGIGLAYLFASPAFYPHLNRFESLAPVDAIVTLQTTEAHAGPKDLIYGKGHIQNCACPQIWPDLRGQALSFALPTEELTDPAFTPETHLKCKGMLTPLNKTFRQPGYETYLYRQGVFFKFNHAHIISQAPRHSQAASFRNYIRKTLQYQRSATHRIYASMLLGEKDLIPKQAKSLFKIAGLMHLFAVSGLHIMMIHWALWSGIQILVNSKPKAHILGLGIILVYIFALGFPPSATRAFCMLSLYLLAPGLKRQASARHIYTFSACLTLITDPHLLHNLGWQLSYLVAGNLIYTCGPIYRFLLKQLTETHWIPPENESLRYTHLLKFTKYALGILLVSLAAFQITLPYQILVFGCVTLSSVLLNLIAIPLATLIIFCGVYALILGIPLPWISSILNQSAVLLIELILKLCAVITQIPGSHIITNKSGPISAGIPALVILLTNIYVFKKHPIPQAVKRSLLLIVSIIGLLFVCPPY